MAVVIEADDPSAIVKATAELADRAGARKWELLYTCPHTPGEPPGHGCDDAEWTVTLLYQGTKIMTSGPTAHEASAAMAVRILEGGRCRCGRTTTLQQRTGGGQCQWTFQTDSWRPGCEAPTIEADPAARGGFAAMQAALKGGNRAQRRGNREGARNLRYGNGRNSGRGY